MGRQIIFRCTMCKHFHNSGLLSCSAFIEIPADIFSGDNNHNKVIEGQIDDYVFEQKKIKKSKKKKEQ